MSWRTEPRAGAKSVAIATASCWLLLNAFLVAAAGAQAPAQLWTKCPSGSSAGECSIPRGIAADPETGHLYVSDQANDRINEFSAWGAGTFVKAWGWGVRNGASELQSCGPGATPPSATCFEERLRGPGTGQFNSPQGAALDSAGNVYIADLGNNRVQKFDPEGNFLLMFGGEVNKTKVEAGGASEAEENLCPFDPGDECQGGSVGTGKGRFGAWTVGSYIAIDTAGTEALADDKVYVGDKERIQLFDADGHYLEDLPDPKGLLTGKTVQSLALDAEGKLFVAFSGKEGVLRLDGAGEELCTAEVERPSAIAAVPTGGVYVVSAHKFGTPPTPLEIVKFNSTCEETERFNAEAEGIEDSAGIATNTVSESGDVDLYVSNARQSNSFIRAYGPPPIKWLDDRPKLPPDIDATFATSVSSESATVRAQINPHFFEDARYYVQYGTEECSKGGCAEQPPPPRSLLTEAFLDEDVLTAAIILNGLTPGTTYHYRFVAQSGGGGPVLGPERSFHTSAPDVVLPDTCANKEFRTGLSARLPDCRAYEAVSPLEKKGDAGGDLGGLRQELVAPAEQATPAGDDVTYVAASAFGPQESAPFIFQYLASRDPNAGWSSRSLNPPASSVSFYWPVGTVYPRFMAFSPSLCEAWYLQDNDLPLAPGAQPGFPDLYEVELCGGEDQWRTLTTSPPSNPVEGTLFELLYTPNIQGFSESGDTSVFWADGALTPDANPNPAVKKVRPLNQLYAADAEGNLRLAGVLPDGNAAQGNTSAGENRKLEFNNTYDNVRHAVAEDGSRVYWSDSGSESKGGKLFLRLNPTEEQSALPFGSASGTGNLLAGSKTVKGLVAASGKGKITSGSTEVTELETTVGSFQVGQPITPIFEKIPSNTTVVACTPACGPNATGLTLSNPATTTETTTETVTLVSPGPMPFQKGQQILGPGIAYGTTIEAVAKGSLTLSTAATLTQIGAAFKSFSPCTEPEKACTIPVSETVSGAKARPEAVAADGSVAIFTVGTDLYEFDAATGAAYQPEPASLIAGGVIEVMGASEDASRVYFASEEDLGGTNPQGDAPIAGKPNLYLYERGAGFAFLGTLSQEDGFVESMPQSLLASRPILRTSRVSPDGLHAAFTSSASLTGYDNAEAESGHAASEVFLYGAAGGGGEAQLACLSCNPSGRRPRGRFLGVGNNGAVEFWSAAEIPGWLTIHHPSRALSEDGGRVFFESYDPLVPRDSNGAVDVYQWEAPGKGACSKESPSYTPPNEGCLDLISSGKGSGGAEFIDASAEGRDVFFYTNSSLVGEDLGLRDLYDARIGGGFPEKEPPEPGCEGEACQNPPPAPEDPTPASAAYEGPGNGTPPLRCRKGQRRVHRAGRVRCVKAKRHRRARLAR